MTKQYCFMAINKPILVCQRKNAVYISLSFAIEMVKNLSLKTRVYKYQILRISHGQVIAFAVLFKPPKQFKTAVVFNT